LRNFVFWIPFIELELGVFGTISVQESTGFIVATGNFMQEAYNAVAYFGGAFNINAGRPF